MRVLVTGHEGFIGQNLVNYIREHTTWVVDGWEWDEFTRPNISLYDWVLHIGAISSTTERNVELIMQKNLEFSMWLYGECIKHNVNLQYSSSASVYGSKQDFNEDAPKDPCSAYAWTKYLFDRWVTENPAPHIRVHGFRYFNVYGNLEDHKGDMMSPVSKFRKQAKETGTIKIFEHSDEYLRDFVCVEDVCKVHVEFINNVHDTGIWNVGTSNPVSFKDVAEAIANKTGATIIEIPMPDKLKGQYQKFSKADHTKFNNTCPSFEWINILEWIKNDNS